MNIQKIENTKEFLVFEYCLEDGKKDLAKESATDSQFYESLFILINDFNRSGRFFRIRRFERR